MEDAFAVVLFVVVGLATVVAVAAAVLSRGAYDDIGRGPFSLDREGAGPGPARGGGGASRAERDAEIRQLLSARNARRAARGEPPLDVEAELARLTAPARDPELMEEVRALVAVRNERRRRRGEPPLDVDEEVERQLRELGA